MPAPHLLPALCLLAFGLGDVGSLKVGSRPSLTTKTAFEFKGNDWLVAGLTGLFANIVNTKTSEEAVAEMLPPPRSALPLSPAQLREGILGDFAAGYLFSGIIDTALYEADCSFTDPTLSFQGLDTFTKNIAAIRPLIDTFVGDNLVTLYSLDALPDEATVRARWRMEASLKLPWRPVLDVQGTTLYSYSKETGKIVRYSETWTENPQGALLKLLRPAKARQAVIAAKRRAADAPAVLYPQLLFAPTEDDEAVLRALEMHDSDLAALAESPPPARYAGSHWQLAFTSSSGLSSGRLGPLRGRVTQEFAPAANVAGESEDDGAVEFINRVQFAGGLVDVALHARAKAAPSLPRQPQKQEKQQQQEEGGRSAQLPRINVEFIETRVKLLGLEVARSAARGRGYWQVAFDTPETRVFRTNAGSVFVLKRLPL